jgi:hypothetical protein
MLLVSQVQNAPCDLCPLTSRLRTHLQTDKNYENYAIHILLLELLLLNADQKGEQDLHNSPYLRCHFLFICCYPL